MHDLILQILAEADGIVAFADIRHTLKYVYNATGEEIITELTAMHKEGKLLFNGLVIRSKNPVAPREFYTKTKVLAVQVTEHALIHGLTWDAVKSHGDYFRLPNGTKAYQTDWIVRENLQLQAYTDGAFRNKYEEEA